MGLNLANHRINRIWKGSKEDSDDDLFPDDPDLFDTHSFFEDDKMDVASNQTQDASEEEELRIPFSDQRSGNTGKLDRRHDRTDVDPLSQERSLQTDLWVVRRPQHL